MYISGYGGNLKQLIVFSLDKPGKPASDTERTVALGLLTEVGLRPREALGVYNSIAERSFMVETDDRGLFALVKSVAMHHNQESVLAVNLESYEATLHYLSPVQRGRREILGHWIKAKEVNKQNMTLDLTDMQIYVVR